MSVSSKVKLILAKLGLVLVETCLNLGLVPLSEILDVKLSKGYTWSLCISLIFDDVMTIKGCEITRPFLAIIAYSTQLEA